MACNTPEVRTTLPRRRIGTAILLAASVAIAALAGVGAAPAIAGGVHFDPTSPAGKEYALPLAQARNEAIGGGREGGSEQPAPLYGAGVSGGGTPGGEPGAGTGNGGSPPGAAGRRGGGGGSSATGGAPGVSQDGRGVASATKAAPGSPSYPLLDFVLIIAGVLAAGVAVGLGLKVLTPRIARRLGTGH
jgi:hypothetical protein